MIYGGISELELNRRWERREREEAFAQELEALREAVENEEDPMVRESLAEELEIWESGDPY